MATRPLRARLIAAIHAQAKTLGLDEETRRAVQARAGGAASCRDMGTPELHRTLDELKRLGGRVAGRVGPPEDRLDGMRRKCLAIAHDVGADAAYVDAIARRQAGKGIDAMDAGELRGVIAALYNHRRRSGGHAVA